MSLLDIANLICCNRGNTLWQFSLLPWSSPALDSWEFESWLWIFCTSGFHSSNILDWTPDIHSRLKSSTLKESKQQEEPCVSSSGFSCFTVTWVTGSRVDLPRMLGSGGEMPSWAPWFGHTGFIRSIFTIQTREISSVTSANKEMQAFNDFF